MSVFDFIKIVVSYISDQLLSIPLKIVKARTAVRSFIKAKILYWLSVPLSLSGFFLFAMPVECFQQVSMLALKV